MLSDKSQHRSGLVLSSDTRALAAGPGRTLAARLIAIFFSTAFLLVIAASGVLYWGTVTALKSADDQVVDKRAETVMDILRAKELNEGLLAHEINEDNQGPRQIFMRVVSPETSIAIETEGMSTVLAPSDFPDATTMPIHFPSRSTIRLSDGRTYRASSTRVPVTALPNLPPAILQVATDTSLDKDSLELFQKILALVVGAALPLSAFCAWYIVNRELKPLQKITSAAQAIDGATLDKRIALAGMPDELHELASHFNSMLARLETTWLDLKHYADTIAHEMRTPLHRMRLDCEIALNKSGSPAETQDVLNSMVDECEHLTRLLQGLLFLARADSKQASLAKQRFSMTEQIATLYEYFEAEAAELGIAFKAECAAELTLDADRSLVQQAAANLLSNAFAHTPKGGEVRLEAERRERAVYIRVSDTGEGIAAVHHERLFDRFYRARNGTGARGERLGLGLSITKRIVELHGGTISLTSAPGLGTCVSLIFPQPGAALEDAAA